MKTNQAHRKGGKSPAIPQGQTRKPARAAKRRKSQQPPAKLLDPVQIHDGLVAAIGELEEIGTASVAMVMLTGEQLKDEVSSNQTFERYDLPSVAPGQFALAKVLAEGFTHCFTAWRNMAAKMLANTAKQSVPIAELSALDGRWHAVSQLYLRHDIENALDNALGGLLHVMEMQGCMMTNCTEHVDSLHGAWFIQEKLRATWESARQACGKALAVLVAMENGRAITPVTP